MTANPKPFILGLTGGTGCGKTTAAAALRELGACVVDADQISHELTEMPGPSLERIRSTFGDAVFLPDGRLDRAALASRIFSNPADKIQLEAILHPAIQKEMLRQMDAAQDAGEQLVVLDVPLLYETGLDVLCDAVLVMTADPEQQVMRVMNRDGITRAQAMARIQNQMPLDEKASRAERVISTNKPIAEVRAELSKLMRDILRKR